MKPLPLLAALFAIPSVLAAPIGRFTGPTDVGLVNRATVASYDPATDTYTLSASGDNMWARRDAFGFVWTQVDGDVALSADITLVGASDQGHRKACLMFRQSLAPDAAYVDVAVHGDGLTSLQFRSEKGGLTREVQAPVRAPKRVRVVRRGDYVFLDVAGDDGELVPSGCMIRLPFTGQFYAGLAVCAHDNNAFETARFARVELGAPAPRAAEAPRIHAIEILPLASLDRKVVYRSADRLESPHFSPDGREIYFNSRGRIHRLKLGSNEPPVTIDTGFATQCNNDHGLSPDGTTLVIGDHTETGQGLIYLLPAAGGTPVRVNAAGPAYWHGWSPDGGTLAYCAGRDGNYDVYTIPVGGGEETRLTDSPGNDNGPDYTPDGQWIYYHTNVTGSFQIWRMRTDGSDKQQVTDDAYANWFPHPSPDGMSVVILSTRVPPETGHPPDGDYVLRLLTIATGEIRELAHFPGGQGSLNVPSWSRDSAYVAYATCAPAP